MFAIALGHPDCNAARVLVDDPIHQMRVGRTASSKISTFDARRQASRRVGKRSAVFSSADKHGYDNRVQIEA